MLLSHHPPSQYCRTYKILGIRFCARCTGIVLGLIIGIVIDFSSMNFLLLLLFPIPTFMNFVLQERKIIPSNNMLKTVLSISLGIYLFGTINLIISDLKLGIILVINLFFIQFLSAYILFKTGDLEKLITEYENGIYK
tara:strand:+ start:315 stop:728 length:414 start_codon:yes stop_codon:yes gene_type:complete